MLAATEIRNSSKSATITRGARNPRGDVMVQAKLTVGNPDDVYEREADSVADQVMRMNDENFVQKKCAHCEEEEKKIQRKPIASFIQKKEFDGGNMASEAVSDKIASTKGSGSGLDNGTKSFMESRFGSDLGSVKIHTDADSILMNRELGAKAFTVGNDIYFNEGQYSPGSANGKHLLAHELTHTIQQNGTNGIQRTCSPENQATYDTIVARIKALPQYKKAPYHSDAIYTPLEVKSLADTIMQQARERDNCLFYIEHLETLFSTPENPPGKVGEEFKQKLAGGALAETERLKDPQALANADVEEKGVDPEITGKPVQNKTGRIYYVDSTDINNIYVKAKVKLNGQKQFTDQVKQMEDGIEKAGSILGYTLNIIFTESTGKDVFETNVDPTKWPTSGNWVGGVNVMAHEIHHLLNLPDRYNYIKSHSRNKSMYVGNRIHWYKKEFDRTEDPNIDSSFMGKGNLILSEDICKVVNPTDAVAEQDCIGKRQLLIQPAIGIKQRAFGKTQRLVEVLAGFLPPLQLDPRGDESTIPQAQQIITKTASLVLGRTMGSDEIVNIIDIIKGFLISARIQMENATDPRCAQAMIAISKGPNAFIVCPAFTKLAPEKQLFEMLKAAYRMYQEVSSTQQYEKMMGRGEPADVADKWAEFIVKASERI